MTHPQDTPANPAQVTERAILALKLRQIPTTNIGDAAVIGEAADALAAIGAGGHAVVRPEPDFAASIAEVVNEESAGGAACGWKSCSGCHETNEGAETGHYPYSKMFGCYVGSGCSECGGIGVVWEHWSDDALKMMAADVSGSAHPAPSGQAVAEFLPTEDGEFNGNALDDAVNELHLSSATAYDRDQLAKLAFAIFYSANLCAPQNIAAVIREIDTCSDDCDGLRGSVCNKAERGDYCPFSLAEDLRQISAALFGPNDPSHYVASVFGPEALSAIAHPVQPGWRDMESAPKDGTRFLAHEKGRHFDCWWRDTGYGEAYWMDDADSEPNPTDWMPLPTAPQPKGE